MTYKTVFRSLAAAQHVEYRERRDSGHAGNGTNGNGSEWTSAATWTVVADWSVQALVGVISGFLGKFSAKE